MKDLYNKYKREIWVGVVVSLITTAILKFGDWVIAVAPSIGNSLFETVSNIMYTLAATYSDNMLFRTILLGSFGALVGTVAKSTIEGIKLYMRILRVEKKSKKFTSEELDEINNEVNAELVAKSKEKFRASFSGTLQEGKRIGKAAIKLVCILAFSYLFITFCITTPMGMYNKFEQNMVKIAPYVESEMITQLKSDWVCMRSKADYDEIYVAINQVIEDNALPK